MPKKHSDFPARLDFMVTVEMRQKLIAIAYQMGAGGEHSTPARNLLASGIDAYLSTLSDKKRAEFDEILHNVKLQEQYRSN